MKYKTILILFIYRIVMAYLSSNYEYPDQYWQGPQVAHRLHYGYGYLTWEWTIAQPLRNPVYPYLLSLSYHIIDALSLHKYAYLAPKYFIQVPLAVLTDIYLLKILTYLYCTLSTLTIVLIFTNWYYACTMTRTYYNTFQTSLTLISFYYWLTNPKLGINNNKDILNRTIATINYISRPTSIIIWGILWPYQLYQIITIYGIISQKSIKYIIKNIINICLMIMGSFIVGTIYNNRLILTQYNFIKYNFIQKWSQLYGQQSILFYFVLTLPFMLHVGLIILVLSIIQIYNSNSNRQQYMYEYQQLPTQDQLQHYQNKKSINKHKYKNIKIIIVFSILYLIISSLSTHKQHRFIFPILPFLLIIMAYCLKLSKNIIFGFSIPRKLIVFVVIVSVIVNICIFGLFNAYGKGDGVTAWNYIGNRMDQMAMRDYQTVVVVLGESHFMPGYSVLHRNITYRIPDSSAVKMAKNNSQNLLLTSNPQKLYRILTEQKKLKPNFIIAQGKYLPKTAQLLVKEGYHQSKMWRHCTIPQQAFFGYDSISIFQPA